MNSTNSVRCKKCGGTNIHVRRYVDRKVKGTDGVFKVIKVKQYICEDCKATMRHLPTNLMPYKQYERSIIEGVIDGSLTSELMYGGAYPAEETMKLWICQRKMGLLQGAGESVETWALLFLRQFYNVYYEQKLMKFNEGVIIMLEGLTLIIVAGTAHMIMDYMERKGMVDEED